MLVVFKHSFIKLRELEMSTNGVQKRCLLSTETFFRVFAVHLLESVGSNDKSNSNARCEGTAGSKVWNSHSCT